MASWKSYAILCKTWFVAGENHRNNWWIFQHAMFDYLPEGNWRGSMKVNQNMGAITSGFYVE